MRPARCFSITQLSNSRTVTHMVGTGRGQELYEAHEKICRMLKERNTNNLNQNIRDTYFENVMKNA